MTQAEILGEKGQILDSERCMNDVERLREKKREIETMGDEQVNAQKQQKVISDWRLRYVRFAELFRPSTILRSA